MRGYYNIYLDGKLVDVAENNITDAGRRVLLRFLSGQIGRFAGAIAVGTGSVVPTRLDDGLNFEFARAAVNLATPDFLNDRIIYKATVDPAVSGYIYELGLYPTLEAPASDFSSKLISGFEPNLETFVGGAANLVNYRIGKESLQLSAAAGATVSTILTNMTGDYSGFGADDSFALSYFTNDTNISNIQFRINSVGANYWRYIITPPAGLGYHVTEITKGSFTAIGTPDWGNITSMTLYLVSTSTGPSVIQLDGLRVNDKSDYPDYALISRAVVANPKYKAPGQQLDIEYVLEFNA